MENNERENEPIPYGAYELAMAREEREHMRMWKVIILLIVLLAATNIGWIVYESQYETFSYEQDGSGVNNFMTSIIGGVNNGTEGAD